MNYIWESVVILFAGFCLIRVAGKKTVDEMTGLEIITILAIGSTIGHAISENGLIQTIISLCSIVTLLILIQFLTIKLNFFEKFFIGKATLIIQDGKVISKNLKKLRISADQLDARLRENGISSITDVKTASIEITGKLGYELMNDAKPVTLKELEQALSQFQADIFQQLTVNEHNLFKKSVQNEQQLNSLEKSK